MDHVLSELHYDPSILVALHSMAQSFIELCKPFCHDKSVIHEGDHFSIEVLMFLWSIYLCSKYLLSACYALGTLPGARDIAENKTEIPPSGKLIFQRENTESEHGSKAKICKNSLKIEDGNTLLYSFPSLFALLFYLYCNLS